MKIFTLHSQILTDELRNCKFICTMLLLLVAVVAVADPVSGPVISGNVYGGGQMAKVDGSTNVDVKSGVVSSDVYGGGAVADVNGNTNVSLVGGQISSAYGGGLGTAEVAAIVTGNTLVTLNGAKVMGDGLFGANNVNGTPQGHAKVHVVATAPKGTEGEVFHVAAVYGGGNKAAYEPTAADEFAEVVIDNCDNRIEYVYGGGNAAPVPATKVTINGADTIYYAFAGGNGKGDGNKGADVGYKGFYSGGSRVAYGTGEARIEVYGGKINSIFGGSNTLGYIREQAYVKVYDDPEIEGCPTDIAELYGGGNEAPMLCPSVVDLDCAKGLGSIYGGAKAVDVMSDVTLNIHSGHYKNVFGGNNKSGNVYGSITVNIEEIGCYPIEIDNLYGGGNLAQYSAYGYSDDGTPKTAADGEKLWNGPTINLISFTSVGNVFGGGYGLSAKVYGDPVVNMELKPGEHSVGGALGTIANVYGGGEDAPTFGDPSLNLANGTVTVNAYAGGKGESAKVTGNPVANLQGATVTGSIFGGGDAAPVEGNPSVVATAGQTENIFAGGKGETAVVTGNPSATIDKANEKDLTISNVYGGGDEAQTAGNPVLYLTAGMVSENAYAGGRGETAKVTGNPTANLQGATVTGSVFGGGDAAPVDGDPKVNALLGQSNYLFGGGKGATAVVNGTTQVMVGDTVTKANVVRVKKDVYGGGDAAAVNGRSSVQVLSNCNTELHDVYGGGNAANVYETSLIIAGGTIYGSAFGGGHGDKETAVSADVTKADGSVSVLVEGGTINQLFGGSNQKGEIAGEIYISVLKSNKACPMHITELYGGGNEAEGKAGHISIYKTGDKEADEGIGDVYGGAQNAEVTSGVVLNVYGGSIGRVFGGNNKGGDINGAISVNLKKDTLDIGDELYVGDVFGGGNKADYSGSPVVTVDRGTVSGSVYGGGALADVGGNTTVKLTGGSIGGAYGGGLGDAEVAAEVGGNTLVTLNGSKVTGDGIFGANNVNGTPLGHVKVHVLRTTPRDGQLAGEYDVPAVYGGGNKAAYVPTVNPNDYAEVLIENCDNSIGYVYGGGNAAPVPATDVKIYGANSIGDAFAGGNGAGADNPGADIGYLGYYSKGSREEYGTGIAYLTIYGGTVEKAFGGSNTLGYIRTQTTVELAELPDDYTGTECPLNVGDVHGGGNEADLYCPTEVILGCTEGAEAIYAGSRSANVYGSVVMTIRSGKYGKVFGGNNESGNIFGKLALTIDETGCWPIVIDELYLGGHKAAYSVYGYDNEGHCIEREADMPDPSKRYEDPVLNIISFTSIGTVFGGGLGETATIYGNTNINIDPIPGRYAARIDADGDEVEDGNADAIGTIGTIYGGGNAGAVYGDTNVKIGTKTKNTHVSGDDKTTAYEVEVNIKDNVFGGGNEAIVSGDTHVTIGSER